MLVLKRSFFSNNKSTKTKARPTHQTVGAPDPKTAGLGGSDRSMPKRAGAGAGVTQTQEKLAVSPAKSIRGGAGTIPTKERAAPAASTHVRGAGVTQPANKAKKLTQKPTANGAGAGLTTEAHGAGSNQPPRARVGLQPTPVGGGSGAGVPVDPSKKKKYGPHTKAQVAREGLARSHKGPQGPEVGTTSSRRGATAPADTTAPLKSQERARPVTGVVTSIITPTGRWRIAKVDGGSGECSVKAYRRWMRGRAGVGAPRAANPQQGSVSIKKFNGDARYTRTAGRLASIVARVRVGGPQRAASLCRRGMKRIRRASPAVIKQFQSWNRHPVVWREGTNRWTRVYHHRKNPGSAVLYQGSKVGWWRRGLSMRYRQLSLWWCHRAEILPAASRSVPHLLRPYIYKKFRIPWRGLRGYNNNLGKAGRRIPAFAPHAYASARWLPYKSLVSPEHLAYAKQHVSRISQKYHSFLGSRLEVTTASPQARALRSAVRVLPLHGGRKMRLFQGASTSRRITDVRGVVSMVYYNTIVGVLGGDRIGRTQRSPSPFLGGAACGGSYLRATVQTLGASLSAPTVGFGALGGTTRKLRYKGVKPFLWLGGTLLIRDLEHYLGASVYLILENLSTQTESANFYILRYCFFIKFGWIQKFFVAPLHEAYLASYYAGACHDLDLLCNFFKEVLGGSYYANAPKLFKIYAQMLCYMWPMYIRYGAGVGLFFELKGKFHRYMTIESQSKRLRLGKTAHSTTNYSLSFRYRQSVNETGAFGVHVYLWSKNELRVFSRTV